MPPPLDQSLIANLPAELRRAVEAQIEALAAERAARLHLDAENADLRASVSDLRRSNAELTALNARLEHLAKELRRARFGPRSEKLSPDQLELAFEGEPVSRQWSERHWRARPRSPRRRSNTTRQLRPVASHGRFASPAHPEPCRRTFRARSG